VAPTAVQGAESEALAQTLDNGSLARVHTSFSCRLDGRLHKQPYISK
jgi:hypothetical protein